MIPPNVNAIIFASVSSASVGALFMATIVPGLIWAGLYLIINRIIYINIIIQNMRVKQLRTPFLHVLKIMSLKKNQKKNARETISRNRFF